MKETNLVGQWRDVYRENTVHGATFFVPFFELKIGKYWEHELQKFRSFQHKDYSIMHQPNKKHLTLPRKYIEQTTLLLGITKSSCPHPIAVDTADKP